MKLIIVGPARHGKDTLADMLDELNGWSYRSSSEFVAERFGMKYLEEKHDLKYANLAECMADRVNHRLAWYESVRAYVGDDKSKLTREILASYDIYVGMRGADELVASRDLINASIWVEAPVRIGHNPDEVIGPNLITKDQCDIVIYNDGCLSDLYEAARELTTILKEF